MINPRFDLFAWLDIRQEANLIFPARVVDKVQVMLPEKCSQLETLPDDIWKFMTWQVEEKGYAVVRSIDNDWIYWSVLADKYTLLNMVRVLI